MTALDLIILRKAYKGPVWSHGLKPVKARVVMLVNAGYLSRVASEGGKSKNMVAITPRGAEYLENL